MPTRVCKTEWVQEGVVRATWAGILNGDDGGLLDSAALSDKCVHVKGTFGAGGSINISGSNDGVTFKTLTDPQGNALVFTTEAIEQILENPLYMKPICTAGDGTTNLTVIIAAKGNQ